MFEQSSLCLHVLVHLISGALAFTNLSASDKDRLSGPIAEIVRISGGPPRAVERAGTAAGTRNINSSNSNRNIASEISR